AIAFQADIERGALDMGALERYREQLPLDTIVRYRVLPHGVDADGRLILLTASPLGDAAIAQLEAQLGGGIGQRIVREGEIAFGLRRLRGVAKANTNTDASMGGRAGDQAESAPTYDDGPSGAAPPASNVPLIGDLLIERGYVRRQAFEAALTDYHPDRHGRIGDFMVARGVVSREAVERVVEEQRRASGLSGAPA
ncbi:MAG TPA: glycosyl transferase family protein, partial [Trinickia sp.]|nr:glycosyl transferase family protein [Trinickia sp.]